MTRRLKNVKAISELRGVAEVRCHTILLAARHKWAHPTLSPASKAGTRFTYPGGMEGWVDLGALIMPRPGIEPTTASPTPKPTWNDLPANVTSTPSLLTFRKRRN